MVPGSLRLAGLLAVALAVPLRGNREFAVTPETIAPSGGTLRFELAEPLAGSQEILLGLAFGDLALIPAVAEPGGAGQRFCTQVPALSSLFTIKPRPGDVCLLVVYHRGRPLAGPRALRVGARPAEPDQPCPKLPSQ